MRKALVLAMSAAVFLSGCTTITVGHSKIAGDKPELVLNAYRDSSGAGFTHGYFFQVTQQGKLVGTFTSDSNAPIVVTGIDPGIYTVLVTGRKIDKETVDVYVQNGERTSVNFYAQSARHAARAEGIGNVIGTGLLYTAGVVFFAIVLVVDAIVSADDAD